MQRKFVMTLIARDRPGLVDSIAAVVAGHGGNWLESRMARLGGQFAGILRAEVPEQQEKPLLDDLRRLEASGLSVTVNADESLALPEAGQVNVLEILGQDRPGIVRQISKALVSHGVNVEELETECASAAMSGETLFKAHARLSIPDSCDKARLRRDLEKIAADLIVDISLADA